MRARPTLALFLFTAISCRPPDDPSRLGPEVRLAIGGQAQLVYLPAMLAQELGYFQSEGVNVTVLEFAGGAKALEALVGGSADVVCGYFDHVIQMAAEGQSLRAFVAMQRFPGLALVVSPSTPRKIERIEDLKGTLVGVSSLGSSTNFLLRYLLSRKGIPWREVSETGIGLAASAVAAMEHGKVDAAVMTDPAITILARRKGRLRILADTRTPEGTRLALGADSYPAATLYARREWLDRNPHLAKAMARAIRKSLDWIHQQGPAKVAAAMPPNYRGDDPELYAETVRTAIPMFSVDGRMPADGPEKVRSVLALSLEKVRDARIDLSATYTNDLLPPTQ